MIKPGRQRLGLLATLLVGVVASVIGGAIANLLGTGSIFELNFLGFVVALISSVVILGNRRGERPELTLEAELMSGPKVA